MDGLFSKFKNAKDPAFVQTIHTEPLPFFHIAHIKKSEPLFLHLSDHMLFHSNYLPCIFTRRTTQVSIILVLGFLIGSISSRAQPNISGMQEYLYRMDRYNQMMLSTCFTKGGQIQFQQAAGYADINNEQALNVFTQLRIGSITKTFTAVMILQLLQEGKLKPDTRLSEFYPELPNSRRITLMHLLRHRSGLHNFTIDTAVRSMQFRPVEETELIRYFASQQPDFEPGLRMSYSNTNYVILSFILEKVTKNSYEKELLKRICSRAGLADTRLATPINTTYNQALSYNYVDDNWQLAPETHPSLPRGAGAIQSTPYDVCRFAEALFQGRLLKSQWLDSLTQLQDGYGCGIFQLPFGERKAWGHNGSIDGFRSVFAYFPDDSTAFCLISNAAQEKLNTAALSLMKLFFGYPFTQPSFNASQISLLYLRHLHGLYRDTLRNKKLLIKKEGVQLFAHPEGEAMYPLQQLKEFMYRYDAADTRIEFIHEEGLIRSLHLVDRGQKYIFIKE